MMNGWIECKLGEIITYQNGRSMEHLFSQYGKYKVISIGNYSLDSRYIDNKVRIDEKNFSEFMKFIPHKNELTMILNDKTSTGEIIGRVLLIDESDRYVINQRTLRITLPENVSPLFFYYLLNSNIVRKSILDSAKPGTQIYINTPDVLGICIHFPINVKEQMAIAAVLSDTDALIAAMEKLIAKKRAIKQGAMQELLTGKRRLSGFSGKWVEKGMEEVIERFATGLNPRQNFVLNSGGLNYYVTIKNFFDGTLYLDNECDKIDDIALDLINARSDLKKDDILFSSIGRVGDAYLITETPHNWNINESVFALRPNKAFVAPKFLFYILKSEPIQQSLSNNSTGSTLMSIKMGHLKTITFSMPQTIAEQTAIASILSDMDAEIDALTKKLNKIKQIKQGMMSELLTGRIRLAEKEDIKNGKN